MNLFKKSTFAQLTSKRLLLRKPTIKDVPAYHHILSYPEISRYSDIPYKPTLKRSKSFVQWMSKLNTRGTGAAWLICLHNSCDLDQNTNVNNAPDFDTTKLIIGSIRINSIEKKASCGRLVYELHPSFWAQGYATEALGIVVKHAHSALSLNRLEAWTIDGNDASKQVLLNNGFQYEGMQREKVLVRDKYQHIHLFGHLASDRC